MVGERSKITLIGTTLARPGLEFVYQGALPACVHCKVRKACNNLRVGRKYRIVSVRNTQHDCLVHLNGASAVECVEAPVVALIGSDMAIVELAHPLRLHLHADRVQGVRASAIPTGSSRATGTSSTRCSGIPPPRARRDGR